MFFIQSNLETKLIRIRIFFGCNAISQKKSLIFKALKSDISYFYTFPYAKRTFLNFIHCGFKHIEENKKKLIKKVVAGAE